MQHKLLKAFIALLVLFSTMPPVFSFDGVITKPDDLPELETVSEMIRNANKIEGVVFVAYDYDESSLMDTLPRLLYYASLIKKNNADLPIAVVSHGDEMLSLTLDNVDEYPDIHKNLIILVNHFQIIFHICGSFARMNNLDDGDFPDYIDVVPFGPSQISDYESLGFLRIDLDESF